MCTDISYVGKVNFSPRGVRFRPEGGKGGGMVSSKGGGNQVVPSFQGGGGSTKIFAQNSYFAVFSNLSSFLANFWAKTAIKILFCAASEASRENFEFLANFRHFWQVFGQKIL